MPTYRSHHDRIHSVQPPMLSQLWHIMADDDDNGVRQRRDALMFLCSVDFNVADNGSLDENHSACCDALCMGHTGMGHSLPPTSEQLSAIA
ncbi:hypothetical protein BJV78DRAFT_1287466 [Lactifluus subvellereus]|nr:hypothetical protein BJV78DRAFT_1287466 [Lactifluus subvellereus]